MRFVRLRLFGPKEDDAKRRKEATREWRGRRQDKSTGTLRLQGVDGVEEFQGPGSPTRTVSGIFRRPFNRLTGTFVVGGQHDL